jgi:hypothetical protein
MIEDDASLVQASPHNRWQDLSTVACRPNLVILAYVRLMRRQSRSSSQHCTW